MTTKYALAVVAISLSLYVAISLAADPPTCQFYGESCINGSKPNATHWLECSLPNLRCRCQTGLYWDASRSSCVAKVGEACYTLAEDGSPLKECTKGAGCFRDPKVNVTDTDHGYRCFCAEAHTVADDDGRCRPTHQGTCNNNAECLPSASLTCDLSQQKCVCDWEGDGKQRWDGSKCASVVGGKCSETAGHYVNRTCLDANAECDPTLQVCKCKDKFYPLGEKCVVGYEGACSDQNDCAPSFSCLSDGTPTTTTVATTTTVKANATMNSRPLNARQRIPADAVYLTLDSDAIRAGEVCTCDPSNSVYDATKEMCRILASKTCDLNSNSTSQCVDNSVCSQSSGSSSLCTCNDGFVAGPDGHCLGLVGSPCTDTDRCLESEFFVCERNTSTCRCEDNYNYKTDTQKCVAPLGSPCNDDKNCNAEGASVCDLTNTTAQYCKCKENYSQQGNTNVCRGSYQQKCDANTIPCNSDEFLNCAMGLCTCQDDHFWSTNVKVCQGYVESRCGGEFPGCVTNATCEAVSSTNSTTWCQCSEGFAVNTNRTCDQDNGATSMQISGVTSLLFAILVAAKNFM